MKIIYGEDYFGDMGSNIHPQDAQDMANCMREVLDMDALEVCIALAVQSFDVGDMDMQMAAWLYLNPREQRAWRTYRGMRVPKD